MYAAIIQTNCNEWVKRRESAILCSKFIFHWENPLVNDRARGILLLHKKKRVWKRLLPHLWAWLPDQLGMQINSSLTFFITFSLSLCRWPIAIFFLPNLTLFSDSSSPGFHSLAKALFFFFFFICTSCINFLLSSAQTNNGDKNSPGQWIYPSVEWISVFSWKIDTNNWVDTWCTQETTRWVDALYRLPFLLETVNLIHGTSSSCLR